MPVVLVTALLIQSAWADSKSPGQTALSGNSEAQQGIGITGKVTSGVINPLCRV